MIFKQLKYTLAFCFLALFFVDCSNERTLEKVRSVYYWNTTFSIDSVKSSFLREHRIDRIYVRYFDVVASTSGDFPVPNATIRIDSMPAGVEQEIVPVVFIMPDALDCDLDKLSTMILQRVKQMSETHDMGDVKELQIDCDWTVSTRLRFFEFMSLLKEKTGQESIRLSVTIRLHQLATAPPPADKGVLMVYNTGDMRRMDKEKPILDPEDVMPYLKYLDSYPLPLASAYPVYRWELLFRNGEFIDIVHSRDELPILKSDTVVVRQTSIDDIMACRRAIESCRPECADEIVLFDLNNYNINRYDCKDFEKMYN